MANFCHHASIKYAGVHTHSHFINLYIYIYLYIYLILDKEYDPISNHHDEDKVIMNCCCIHYIYIHITGGTWRLLLFIYVNKLSISASLQGQLLQDQLQHIVCRINCSKAAPPTPLAVRHRAVGPSLKRTGAPKSASIRAAWPFEGLCYVRTGFRNSVAPSAHISSARRIQRLPAAAARSRRSGRRLRRRRRKSPSPPGCPPWWCQAAPPWAPAERRGGWIGRFDFQNFSLIFIPGVSIILFCI